MRNIALLIAIILIAGCKPETFVPKPRGYYRIELPAHAYQHYNKEGFPYEFDYPVYGQILKDESSKPSAESQYWINIDFPVLGGRIYLTYKEIDAAHPLEKLLEDAHEMSYSAHSKKADFINAPAFHNDHGVNGVFYNIGGNAATTYQFFATDSVKHYLRGALYFDVTPNADSLKPVNDFLKKDMEHLIGTLRWK